MSEYWKSTPKYWCKHCSVYVRDTKLERTNHEATARHQGAIKRSLRELHRNADQQEREKERARREVERLNGVVSGSSSNSAATSKSTGGSSKGGAYGASAAAPVQVSEEERQRQLEQLASLGVNIPTELRGNMAMAGEWTVTKTRIVEDTDGAEGGVAMGVKRERERTEEEKEAEEAMQALFKKPRRWGVDSKRVGGGEEEDRELDELLSERLVAGRREKEEAGDGTSVKKEEVRDEGGSMAVKEEGFVDGPAEVKQETDAPTIKKEVEEGQEGASGLSGVAPAAAEDRPAEGAAAVMFKKRKPKNMRQK